MRKVLNGYFFVRPVAISNLGPTSLVDFKAVYKHEMKGEDLILIT